MSQSRLALLNYRLPPTIQSLQDGWQLTCQSGTIVSALLAATAAQLFTYFKDPKSFGTVSNNPEGARTFLLLISYSSMFFNVSACIGSFVLLDRLGELPFRASQKRQSTLPSEGSITANQDALLKRFGAGALWTLVVWHWIISYLTGIWCIIIQLLTYIWLQENLPVKILMSCLATFSLLPMIALIAPGLTLRDDIVVQPQVLNSLHTQSSV